MTRTMGGQNAADVTESRLKARPAGSGHWVVWVLSAVLILTLVTDLIFYTGFFASDDLQYLRGAVELAQTGRLTHITFGTIRLGIMLPLAVVARVTNESMFAMTVFFLVFHLLMVVGTYWVGRLVHGVATGLLAAGFIAICPLAAIFATMMLPDHAATGLTLLSAGAVLVGLRGSTVSSGGRRAYWAIAGGGVLFGLALTAKVPAIFALPAFIVVIATSARRASVRQTARLEATFLAGIALVAIMYIVGLRGLTGIWSPLQHPFISERMAALPELAATKPYFATSDRLSRLISFGRSQMYLGVFRWAVPAVLLVYPLLKRRSWLLYLTFIWLCVYKTWGTLSITRYAPPPIQIRYFVFVLPLVMVMSAYIVVTVARPLWSRAAGRAATRRLFIGLAALLGLIVIGDSYGRLNRLAGKAYSAGEVSSTRYAVDFGKTRNGLPVVLSKWLSRRAAPSMGDDQAQVVVTNATTDLEAIASVIRREQGRFLYAYAEREPAARQAGQLSWSPLDEAIHELAGENEAEIRVYELGTFNQFKSRLAGLRYLYGGTAAPRGVKRGRGRGVVLTEVTLVPEELPEDEAVTLDLSQAEVWEPTWVHRLETCDFRLHPDGSLECQIVGSDDTSGGQYGGVRLNAGGFRAIRLEVSFSEPEGIGTVFVDLAAGPGSGRRLRWQSTPEYVASLTDSVQELTFALDRPTSGFSYVGGEASPADLDHVQFFVRLRDLRARTSFRIHRVLFWPRSTET